MLFSFQMHPQGSHSLTAGKEEGVWVTWVAHCWVCITALMHFKEIPPGEGSWGGKTGKHQSRSVHAERRLSISALTQWRREQRQNRNGTAETSEGSENKRSSMDMNSRTMLELPIITHFYDLHTFQPCLTHTQVTAL